MKIGILTQPLHLNYGGVLQAWALQQVLKQLGHTPEIIARSYNVPPLTVKRLSWQITVTCWSIYDRHIRNNKRTKIYNPFKRNYGRWFSGYCDYKFIKKYISRTKELYSDKEFIEWTASHQYEAYIVGSDQVWRQEYSPRIETYFLDFLSENDNRPRIAYAASFGKEKDFIESSKMSLCRMLLSRFKAISVRENTGVSIITDEFGRNDAVQVLDPTLLLDAEIYSSLITTKDTPSYSYLTAYILDADEDKECLINDVSASKGLPVKKIDIECRGVKMKTVPQWLASFKNASFVVTDSFHGMVFSIIFNKQFIVYANPDRGLDRFVSLLGELGLKNRLIYSYSDYCNHRDELTTPIDYNIVNNRLMVLRKQSVDWLKTALKNG